MTFWGPLWQCTRVSHAVVSQLRPSTAEFVYWATAMNFFRGCRVFHVPCWMDMARYCWKKNRPLNHWNLSSLFFSAANLRGLSGVSVPKYLSVSFCPGIHRRIVCCQETRGADLGVQSGEREGGLCPANCRGPQVNISQETLQFRNSRFKGLVLQVMFQKQYLKRNNAGISLE